MREIDHSQGADHNQRVHMRHAGHQGAAQSLAGVNQWIDQYDDVQDGEGFQRAPGIIGAAEHHHGREYQAEHQADLGLSHAATEGEAAGRGEERHQ